MGHNSLITNQGGAMLFALICDDKPGALPIRKENRPDHLAYLKGLGDTLKFAGPFTKEDGETMSGSVFGDKGSVHWPSGTYYSTRNRVNFDAQLKAPGGLKRAHTAELHDFYDCVTNKKPSPVPYQETVKVIAILESIYKSEKTQREVKVKI